MVYSIGGAAAIVPPSERVRHATRNTRHDGQTREQRRETGQARQVHRRGREVSQARDIRDERGVSLNPAPPKKSVRSANPRG